MARIFGSEKNQGGSRNEFVFLIVCCVMLAELASAAPAAIDKDSNSATVEEERPLVRIKRADEVSFGNHQNEPSSFDKKSVPAVEEKLSDVSHDVAKRDVDDVNTSSDVTEGEGPIILPESVEEESPQKLPIMEDEDDMGNEADFGQVYGTEDEDNIYDGGNDGESVGDDAVLSRRKRNVNSPAKSLNAHSFSKNPKPIMATNPKSRSLKRRSVSPQSMMIAENMGSAGKERSMRSKRDLSYEELSDLVDGEPQYVDDQVEEKLNRGKYFEPLYYGDDVEEKRNAFEDVGGPDDDEEEDEVFLPPSKEEAIEKEILRYEVVRKLLKEKEEEEAKEAIVDYLLQAAEERLREAVEEEREAELREEEAELLRQSSRLSKRYPYSYEPYGGRWGALVPGAKRSGRHSYDNLYRLAQALNDNDLERDDERNDEEDDDEKKK